MKPAGLKMGMGSDEEGGFGSDDDEDIDSDFSDVMSDEAPKKKSQAKGSKVRFPQNVAKSEPNLTVLSRFPRRLCHRPRSISTKKRWIPKTKRAKGSWTSPRCSTEAKTMMRTTKIPAKR
jgi:hypothetical protein